MRVNFKSIWQMLVKTGKEWNDDDPWRNAAIVAYYAIFSMPGLLMMIIWIAGIFFGQEAIQGQVSGQIQEFLGADAAEGVEDILTNAQLNKDSWVMQAVGIGTLVFGATTLFFQLQKSLNHIWEVEAAPDNGIVKLLTDRAYSLGLILVIAFLLLITLVLSGILSVLAGWIERQFGEALLHVVEVINFLIPLGVVTLLFAIMFKVLPDVKIGWNSVWVGAFVTAILFTIGKTLLGLYFGYSNPGSAFGAAGTVILVMLWVNYTALILFFGAEFTQVHAHKYGHPIEPSAHAKWTAEHILAANEKSGDGKVADEIEKKKADKKSS